MSLSSESFFSIVLQRLPGLTQSQALQALRHYGTAEAALSDRGGANPKWSEALSDVSGMNAARERAEKEMDFCAAHDIDVLPISHPKYPVLLAECPDPPIVLFYRGTAALNRRHVVSVVGTRRITDYGRHLCHEFCTELGRMLPDALVVSGLAYGVDIHAHRAALASGLDTVGVLAHGLDRIYPNLHRDTAAEMVRQGGLLTEYLTGTNPDKGNFVRRNRIVAGMSPLTIVVESADKGGALITARLAGGYGREVAAFPGRAGDEYSAGCNRLILRKEAELVTCAEDVLQMMNWKAQAVAEQPSQPQLFPESEFSPEAQAILDVLRGTDGLSQNQIIEQTRLNPHVVGSTLSMLLIEGTIRKLQAANAYALM